MECRDIGLKFPTRISINITRKCNLECKHCLSSAGRPDSNELTTQELFQLIDQLKEAGKPTLAIGGGEPLMRNDLFEIIAYARKNDIGVSIVTNGTLITEEIARALDKLELTSITVSIDGLKKNHDFIRGKGTFEKAIRGIKILKEYVKTAKLSMRMIVNRKNISDCSEVIQLAERLKLDSVRLTPVLPLGRAEKNQYLILDQSQYLQLLKDCHKVSAKVEVVLPDGRIDPKMIRPGEFGCHCGREICWITQTGEVYPCIFFGEKYSVGNVRKEKFIDLWEKSKEAVRFSGNDTCNNCENYKNCRGGCRARALWHYGDINAIDPYCPLNKNKKIFRQPYQVLIFPYIKTKEGYLYAIFKRKDLNFWQGISGGGENSETPIQSAKREAFEETKINKSSKFIKLDSMTTIPIANVGSYKWGENIFVLLEYSFGVEVLSKKLDIGEEHSTYKWLPYEEAEKLLKYDSNKSALWELNYRLTKKQGG